MVPFTEELGIYLRQKRENAGLSQVDTAKKLGYTSSQMVSKWERGLCGPSFADLKRLIKIFNMNETELLNRLIREQRKIFDHYLNRK